MALASANDTGRLAGKAASLSTELYSLQERCSHKVSVDEMGTIADELAKLSTTLWHLSDAVNTDPSQYTEAFNEDLQEITDELNAVFEEISECSAGLQVADSYPSSVAWFFRKGRVSRLLKHLDALKGTLLVMRTVLWHGKDYGTHTSDRLAESNPHTMHEDKVILESMVASNRNAILDLHDLANIISSPAKKSIERTASKAGDHHKSISDSTGVEIPPIPDVLPPTAAEREEAKAKETPPSSLRRTFSKRGVRLGVHMSILDLSAHEAPAGLKKKWIQQAGTRHKGITPGLTALPELSRISEVDTSASSTNNLQANLQTLAPDEPTVPTIPESPVTVTPGRGLDVPQNTPAGLTPTNTQSCSSRKEKNSTIGGKLRRVVSKLSRSNLRSPTRNKSQIQSKDPSEASDTFTIKDQDKSADLSAENLSPETAAAKGGYCDKPARKPFLESLKRRFERADLRNAGSEKGSPWNKSHA